MCKHTKITPFSHILSLMRSECWYFLCRDSGFYLQFFWFICCVWDMLAQAVYNRMPMTLNGCDNKKELN